MTDQVIGWLCIGGVLAVLLIILLRGLWNEHKDNSERRKREASNHP